MPSTRRYNVALAIAFGLVSTAVIGFVAGAEIEAGAMYPLKATAVFAVLTTAIIHVSGAQHPHSRFGPANYVTTMRAAFVALVAGLIGFPAPAGVLSRFREVADEMVAFDRARADWRVERARLQESLATLEKETDASADPRPVDLVWQHDKAGAWVLLCGLMRTGLSPPDGCCRGSGNRCDRRGAERR